MEKKNLLIVETDLIMGKMNAIELLHGVKRRYGNGVQTTVITMSDESDNLTMAFG